MNISRKSELNIALTKDLSQFHRNTPYPLGERQEMNGWNRCLDRQILTNILREMYMSVQKLKLDVRGVVERIQKIDLLGDNVTEEDKYNREQLLTRLETYVGKDNAHNWFSMNVEERWQKVLDVMESKGVYLKQKFPRTDLWVTTNNDGNLYKQERSVKRSQRMGMSVIRKNYECFMTIPGDMTDSELYAELSYMEEYFEDRVTMDRLYLTKKKNILQILSSRNGNGNGNGGSEEKNTLLRLLPKESMADFTDVQDILGI